ncbi:MAG: 50S ribosomal protein L13 [Verrucomicrobiota bacterium]
MKTTASAKATDINRQWWIIDAKDQVVGRVAERAAVLLRGKHKALYTPHIDSGDFVVIINADKAVFTGKKEVDKTYTYFSGYVGGLRSENPKKLRERRPELMMEKAVKGMIPHNRLGRSIFKKLHVYKGDSHPHEAQKPQMVSTNNAQQK